MIIHGTPAMSIGYMVTPKKAKIKGRKVISRRRPCCAHEGVLKQQTELTKEAT
jgi:hypothetical protein